MTIRGSCPGTPCPAEFTLLGRFDVAPTGPSRYGRAGCSPATGEQVAVAFTVDRVLVSCPYEEVSVRTRVRRPIPLDVYAFVEPDRMAVALSRMIPHLNRDHSQDVRALAAFGAGLPVRNVIGAELNHLERKRRYGHGWSPLGWLPRADTMVRNTCWVR